MAEYDYDIGIIGGGAAGLTVAAGAARLGVKVLLIEREEKLGGDCLHYGCVPSKTLIKTARVYSMMKNAEKYGLPAVSPQRVDYSEVAARIKSVIDTIQHHDSEERFCSLGAKVEFGTAEFTDEHTVRFSGKLATAGTWLLATGSSPSVPPIPGLSSVPYLTNMDVFSLEELPESLLVLGGGPIAVEMAQSFARLGAKVRVIQRSRQILSKEDPDMAVFVQTRMEQDGVSFDLGATPKAVRHGNGVFEIDFEQEGQLRTVQGSQLLVAMGRAPNVSDFGLDRAGVEFDKRGVVVDQRLRTSRKHIYAAGDVLGKYLFTHAAGYEGGIVLSNAVFHLPRKVDYTWLPWCTYADPELASIGMNEKAAKAAGREYTVWEESFGSNDRALAEGAGEGKVKLLLDRKGRPLGVQTVGMHAGDLLGEWVAALNSKAGLSTLASAIHPYPTLVEINKRVAGKVLGEKLFSDKVRKTLGFLFDYKGRACTIEK